MDMGAGENLNYKCLAFGLTGTVYKYDNCVHHAAVTTC